MNSQILPTERFSNRVENYVRFRPGYPAEVIEVLHRDAVLRRESIIADVGSGTGISAKLFLDHGNTVYGVEPNREMREAAEKLLGDNPRFRSIDGTAENTTLADGSVDFIVAGQAFHWFDRGKAKNEFIRILRPGGWCVLLWNSRRMETAFDRAYESLLHEFGTDYHEVNHKNIDTAAIADFFSPAAVRCSKLPNAQVFDFDGLLGRIESCSYMPVKGHPKYSATRDEARRLFDDHQSAGSVRMQYETEMYFGQLN